MNFEEGMRATVAWYREHQHRFGNIESALVAHPRQGHGAAASLGSK